MNDPKIMRGRGMRAADSRPLVRIWAPAPRPGLLALTLALALSASCAPARTGPGEAATSGRQGAGQGARAAAALAPTAPGGASADTVVSLYLLGTTDVHGHLYPYDYYTGRSGPGLALVAPLVDSVRQAHPGATYLFDSGDLLQGTPLTLLAARRDTASPNPVIQAMNLLGYAASAVGNHEYNYGIPALDRALAQARFPFVSANVFRAGTDVPAYRPYVLIPHVVAPGDTILIGVTGVTPPGVLIWDRDNVRGKLDFRDPVTSLKPVVAALKARGADLVVVLNHGGFEGTSYDTLSTGVPPENAGARIAREIPGIDVVFLGHTHRQVADSTIHGVLFTQAGRWAEVLADVEVTLARRGPSDWTVVARHAQLLRPDPQHADTALLVALRAAHERALAYVGAVLGRVAQGMDASRARAEDTPILDFVNEVQRRAAGAQLSATAAFSLAARLPAGPVTLGQLAALYPYDNTLAAVRISGRQLRAYLEKSASYFHRWPLAAGESLVDRRVPGYNFDALSGADYTIDVSRPAGERITRLTYQGRAVLPTDSFTIALNNYRQGGGGGYSMVADAPVVYDRQQDIRDLLVEEVRRRGEIRPADYFHANWHIVPEAAREEILRETVPRAAAAGRAPEPTAAAGGRADERDTAAAGKSAAAALRLRVLTTNDFHGHLLPETYAWSEGRPVGGAAALAAYFRAQRDSVPGVPAIALDAGDEMQGTPISNLVRGASSVGFFNALGVRAAAIGNHEFDWGVAVLRERMAQAHYPWLSANIFVAGSDTAPSWVRDTAMLRVGNVTVGLIGLTTQETPSASRAENVAGLAFGDGAAAMDRWVPVLRGLGADFVIVLAHSGGSCAADGTTDCHGEVVDWAERVRERPDLIVAGHTHRLMRTVVNGIPIVQAAAYGQRFGVVDLERPAAAVVATGDDAAEARSRSGGVAMPPTSSLRSAPLTGRVRAVIRDVPVAWADRIAPDSALVRLVADDQAAIGPRVHAPVADIARRLPKATGDYALGRLIADGFRAETGARVGFINNGGIRAEVAAGPLTWGKLYEVQPFENRLVVLTLTGARLREAVEQALRRGEPDLNVSGLQAVYDPARPAGKRVLTLRLDDGSIVQDGATYTAAMPDFLAGGGDGYTAFLSPVARRDTTLVDLDALIAYLRSLPQPVRAPDGLRFQLVPGRQPAPVSSAGTPARDGPARSMTARSRPGAGRPR